MRTGYTYDNLQFISNYKEYSPFGNAFIIDTSHMRNPFPNQSLLSILYFIFHGSEFPDRVTLDGLCARNLSRGLRSRVRRAA